MKGIVKIGLSAAASPASRLKSLSSTSVSDDFYCEGYGICQDSKRVEARLHCFFDEKRLKPNKEFFEVSPDAVLAELEKMLGVTMASKEQCAEVNDVLILKKGELINYLTIGLKVGDPIVFKSKATKGQPLAKLEIASSRHVLYDGEPYTLGGAVKVMRERDISVTQNFNNWYFKDTSLQALYNARPTT